MKLFQFFVNLFRKFFPKKKELSPHKAKGKKQVRQIASRKAGTNAKIIKARVEHKMGKFKTYEDAYVAHGLGIHTYRDKRSKQEKEEIEKKVLEQLEVIKKGSTTPKSSVPKKAESQPQAQDLKTEDYDNNPFKKSGIKQHKLTKKEIQLFDAYMTLIKAGSTDKDAREKLQITPNQMNKWRTQEWVRNLRDPVVSQNKKDRQARIMAERKKQKTPKKPESESTKQLNKLIELVSKGTPVLSAIKEVGLTKYRFYQLKKDPKNSSFEVPFEKAKEKAVLLAKQKKEKKQTSELEDKIKKEIEKAEQRKKENPEEYRALLDKIEQASLNSQIQMTERIDESLAEYAYGEDLQNALIKNKVDPLIFSLRKKFNVGNILRDVIAAEFSHKTANRYV